jgi:galactoside O-acetyltransferase
MAYLNASALRELGFASLGEGVRISEYARIYRPDLMHIGNHVRIDDFAVISASEKHYLIGRNVHISPFCLLVGRETIELGDFSGLSGRVSIYSSTDDYSGEFLTNPTLPEEFRNVHSAAVHIGAHSIIGAGTSILPGVAIGQGSAVSAMSLVTKSIGEGVIAGGIPARRIKSRSEGWKIQLRNFLGEDPSGGNKTA